MSLSLIQDTVQQVAEAITAALDLETEIVDSRLMIIGGTGRYARKIGTYEEDGDIDAPYIYAECLRRGLEYINFNPESDPKYDSKEGEMAEICCPIKIETQTVGLIGLIAFTAEQRKRLIDKTSELRTFLRIMSELISGKLVLSESNSDLQYTLSSLISTPGGISSFDNIVSSSKEMELVKRRALQVAQSDSSILITGESGTGKGLLAMSIHEESTRAKQAFISVNCAAIPEMLLESELFGYEKGAFTGASNSGKPGKFLLANHGTIFLDEIGDMPIHLQVKLLSCLQNRQIDPIGSTRPIDLDVRVIAATNKDLERLIANNQFREDLYFRLNVIPIHILPLRERIEDLDILIDYTIQKFNAKLKKNISGISEEARNLLRAYNWPGNIREVENIIEYAINMENTSSIETSSLPDQITCQKASDESSGSLKQRISFAERKIISECLKSTGDNLEGKKKTAALLGISESTLYRKMRILGMIK